MSWLFLVAYTCSGLAGLIYQVCWTRWLTLTIGHSTGAASAVVAAFLGGLAAGAAIAGVFASRVSSRRALHLYAALELAVATWALLIPLQIRALTPTLAWAYGDGSNQTAFAIVRLAASVLMVFVPATALGATFPLAVRYYATGRADRARSSGALYALNSVGAAAGALLAGFVLIPRIGVSGTTVVGVGASVLSAALVIVIARQHTGAEMPVRRKPAKKDPAAMRAATAPHWLAATVLGVSGFASLVHEIAWTRVLTLVFGPTTYAFAATLSAVIVGIAIGSGVSAWLVARTRVPAMWLAVVLAAGAGVGIYTSSLAGGPLPRLVAEQIAAAPNLFNELLWRGAVLTALMVTPTAALVGAAFPFAFAMIDDPQQSAARQFGSVYAINTAGSVLGAMAAGFLLIPTLGLETTLRIVALCSSLAAVLVLSFAAMTQRARVSGAVVTAGAIGVMFLSPSWDRELLASGVYMYAPFVPKGLPIEPLLKAGELLYYREGAAATVSVKRLTGTNTLAVDGKTDASNRGDMLTQKLVAHLPLLLHEAPREVAVIGLGSGVTVGSALTHPITRADVIELSPEVVAASAIFADENRHALRDPRTRVLVADGRAHLQLTPRKYDVIISEPSNPWIAGVAALFTREFFASARDRLSPGGVICQWANAYNISDPDLRAIVATFREAFPHSTAWLVGADDVVLIGSDRPLDDRLDAVARHWTRPGVSEDLARVGATSPFTLWSLYVAGAEELATYAETAEVLTDDRMRLEFSAPRELGAAGSGRNAATLRALLPQNEGPAAIRQALATAGAREWLQRADMMFRRDAFTDAFTDYQRALTADLFNRDALNGLVRTAVLTNREAEAIAWITEHVAPPRAGSPELTVAKARLLAASGSPQEAVDALRKERDRYPLDADVLTQLAMVHADGGNRDALEGVVQQMRNAMPAHAATAYYSGVTALLGGNADEAVQLAAEAISRDPGYAAAHDLMGAAHVQRGERDKAREAFLASLRADAHDSAAYANLGILALDAGRANIAIDFFAEALWLDAESAVAREGLRQAMAAYSASPRN